MIKCILLTLAVLSLGLFLTACTRCEHVYGEWSVTTEATCSREGVKMRVCKLCKSEETAPAEKTAHDFSKNEILPHDANLKSPATCQSRPEYYKLCAACNAISGTDSAVFREGNSISHEWDDGEVTEPTCELGGSVIYACKTCDRTNRETIPALGHEWDAGIIDPPGCTAAGATVYTCGVCNQSMRNPIPPAHTWGAWSTSDDGTTDSRICLKCDTPQSREAFVGDGKTVTTAFSVKKDAKGNTLYIITVPGKSIKYTGIYRLRMKGSFTAGQYASLTTSSDGSITTRGKLSEADADGYTKSWHETLICAVDKNDDGVNEDVTLTLNVGTAAQEITEISLSLVGEVVAYTSTFRAAEGIEGTVGTLPAVKAGSYTVAAFYGAANHWTTTVRINGVALADSAEAVSSGVSALGNYVNGSVQHAGSTNTAGLQLLGDFTLQTDSSVRTSFTYTGHVVTGDGKNFVPIFLMILAENLP